LNSGIRAFDLRVYYTKYTVSDISQKYNNYYCEDNTLGGLFCYDFIFMSDVFPLGGGTLRTVMD
jgi:hypothetical protein